MNDGEVLPFVRKPGSTFGRNNNQLSNTPVALDLIRGDPPKFNSLIPVGLFKGLLLLLAWRSKRCATDTFNKLTVELQVGIRRCIGASRSPGPSRGVGSLRGRV